MLAQTIALVPLRSVVGAASPWNSLEVVKLVVGILTPVVIVLLGLVVNRQLKVIEHRQWVSEELAKKRLELYDRLAPRFNDLLCYFTYVGSWKDFTPPEIIRMKRTLDRDVYLAAPLLSEDFMKATTAFIEACYSTFGIWGADAQLRSRIQRRREAFGTRWDAAWEQCFDSQNALEIEVVRDRYDAVIGSLVTDIKMTSARRSYGPPDLSLNVA